MKKSISVCVVEDIEEVRQGVKQILDDSEGFECAGAFGDAEGALDQIQSLGPDIVLMDINLPGMSGIECIRILRQKNPDIQFMMFTIYEDDEKVFDALSAGANGYLLKKTPHDKILESLRELYSGGAPMSTHIARKVVGAFRKTGNGNDAINTLSNREKEVLGQLAGGFLYKEIGDQLGISTGTVRQHIHRIYEKLHVQNRTEAVNKYYGRDMP